MVSNILVDDQAVLAYNIYLIIYECVDNYGSRYKRTYIKSTQNPGFYITFFEILGFLIQFSWEHLKSSHDAVKATPLNYGLLSWKIAIPTLWDINVPTNWNEYKFFSVTQKVLEIVVIVYSMTKNPNYI